LVGLNIGPDDVENRCLHRDVRLARTELGSEFKISQMVDLHHHLGRDPRRPTVIGMQAFVKKTQKIPPGAIELALRRAKEIEP
jgi:hypothetical protein